MSLKELSSKHLIKKHRTDPTEIQDLLAIAERDIEQAESREIYAVWRLAIAHNAIIQCASAALRAEGYRERGKEAHKTLIASLQYTAGISSRIVNRLQKYRKKRNVATYDKPDSVSDGDADAALETAHQIRRSVVEWMRKTHPVLLETGEPDTTMSEAQ